MGRNEPTKREYDFAVISEIIRLCLQQVARRDEREARVLLFLFTSCTRFGYGGKSVMHLKGKEYCDVLVLRVELNKRKGSMISL